MPSTFSYEHLPFQELSFGKIMQDYLSEDEDIATFYQYPPNIESFEQQILDQKATFSKEKGAVLIEALQQQYNAIQTSEKVLQNIALLDSADTFTVTTGHQLTIFGSPMYFIYKIVSTIRCTQILKEKYPDYNFVPMFWMASEDHDFEEIASLHLFGKTYTWENDQKGAVGRMSTKGLHALLDELPEELPLFRKAYEAHETLTEATSFFVDQLFSEYGLVCIDGDDQALKKLFAPIMKRELIHKPTVQCVNQTSQRLAEHGYKVQVNPREINLFYLDDQIRDRIVFKDGNYHVLNQDLTFSTSEMLTILEETPEKISPNALLRPVYQQCILPNLAYIGGGGELAYWLQLLSTFDNLKVADRDIHFPLLMLRNMGLVFSKGNAQKYEKLGLSPKDIFLQEDALRKHWVTQNSETQLKLDAQKDALLKTFEAIKDISLAVDKSLGNAVEAEAQKAVKIIQNLEKRLQKAEERKQETSVKQLLNLKEKLFPNRTLQERYESHLTFQINDPDFISKLMDIFDPFAYGIYLLMYK